MARYYRIPFASTGNKAAIPDAQQDDNTVSFTEGYGPEYELNPSTETGALNIERDKFNQALFDITDNLKLYYETGTPPFITNTDNGGTDFSYSYCARVRVSNAVYESLTANNSDPVTDRGSWRLYDPQFMSRVRVFSTAGVASWTVPTNVTFAHVRAIGGGGGGSRTVSGEGAAGGGGGGYSEELVDLNGVSSVSVTVGAGGAGRTVSAGIGGNGGTSSFGSFLSATGGIGGFRWLGGSSGAGTGGQFNTGLGPGSNTSRHDGDSDVYIGGSGGGPGARHSGSSGTAGQNATLPGGGGSGGSPNQNGGNGAPGIVIIQY